MILSFAISSLTLLDSKPVLSLVLWKIDSSQSPELSPPLQCLLCSSWVRWAYPSLPMKLPEPGVVSFILWMAPLFFGILQFSLDFSLLTSWSTNPCYPPVLTCVGAFLEGAGVQVGLTCDRQNRVVRPLAKERKCCPKLALLSLFPFWRLLRTTFPVPRFPSSQWLQNPVFTLLQN